MGNLKERNETRVWMLVVGGCEVLQAHSPRNPCWAREVTTRSGDQLWVEQGWLFWFWGRLSLIDATATPDCLGEPVSARRTGPSGQRDECPD